ncbi:MAG TPA: protein translocase subunit SecF [Acidobacteriota bacterium]|jgi:preprotein translocase subunit SecF|nr:protein translocase subunit SecF [Acidobacteriota bacterium]
MQLFKNVNVDWLGLRWFFIGLSLVLTLAGTLSLYAKRGPRLGVDFTGGTLVYVRFSKTPEMGRIREALRSASIKAEEVTAYDEPQKNEVQIKLARVQSEEAEDLSRGSSQIFDSLRKVFDPGNAQSQKVDVNSVGGDVLTRQLQEWDPEKLRGRVGSNEHYSQVARDIIRLRTGKGGLLASFDQLREANVPAAVIDKLKQDGYLGSFTVLSTQSVGPKVGHDLQVRAQYAILSSLLGMLVYIAFRFKPIYGVAAIIALFHDVYMTLGFFSLTHKEITLTVVAALLTLTGYSINDTIVVFDRIRENLKGMRREDLRSVVNASINQTLNRTVTTSGLTFLSVLALYLFGGEVLNGFSFALVVGIIVGTYSSIAIAAPILVWWQALWAQRKLVLKRA